MTSTKPRWIENFLDCKGTSLTTMVTWPNLEIVFNLITNTYSAPTTPAIVFLIGGDSNLQHMGQYAVNDAGTDALETGCIVPVPHILASLWLAYPDGLTLCQFWADIFSVIDANCLAEVVMLFYNYFILLYSVLPTMDLTQSRQHA